MKASIWIILVVLLVGSVSAVTPRAVVMTSCGFNDSSVGCSEVLKASCNVVMTNGGNSSIIGVDFLINDNVCTGTLVSGTDLNGVWACNYTAGSSDQGQSLELNYAVASISDSTSCIGSNKPSTTTGECYVSYTAQTLSANTCSCTYTNVAGTSNVNNTRDYSRIPNAGCADQSITSYETFYDYCDPSWTPSYSACVLDGNASYPTRGTMMKEYISANPTCCGNTQPSGAGDFWANHDGGTDCTPPPDQGATVSCYQDFVSREGDTIDADFGEKNVNGGFNYSTYTEKTASIGVDQWPIVADVNGDGVEEVVVVSNSAKTIYIYDKDMSYVGSLVLTGTVSFSQPAFWGMDDLGGGRSSVQLLIEPNPKLVVPMIINGTAYVKAYSLLTGTPVETQSTSLGAVTVSGVGCYKDYCYFGTSGSGITGYKWDPFVGTISSGIISKAYAGSWLSLTGEGMDKSMVPSFSEVTRTGGYYDRSVVWWGNSSNVLVDVFVTTTDLASIGMFTLVPSGYSGNVSTYQTAMKNGAVNLQGQYAFATTEMRNASRGYFDLHQLKMSGILYDHAVLTSDVNRKNLWTGDFTTASYEGVSNAVSLDCSANGGVGVEYQSLTATQSGVSSFTTPSEFILPTTSQTQVYVSKDRQYELSFVDTIASSGTLTFKRIAGDVTLFTASWNQNSCTATGFDGMLMDADDKAFYYAEDLPNCGPSRVKIWKVSYANPESIVPVMIYDSGLGGITRKVTLKGVADESIFFYVSSLAIYGAINSRYGTGSDLRILANPFSGSVIFYDSDNDVMISSGSVVQNFSDYVASNGTSGTISSLPASNAVAYNGFYSNPKIMNIDGRKMKISSWSPFTATITTTSCPNFEPLYYGSDRYILGATTDGNSTNWDRLAYCDFSVETLPVVTKYTRTVGYPQAVFISSQDNYADSDWLITDGGGKNSYYEFDKTREAPLNSSSVSNYGFAACYDWSTLALVRAVALSFVELGMLTSGDVDADGQRDLISPGGIASMGANTAWLKTFSSVQTRTNDTVIPVDLDNNNKLDLVMGLGSSSTLKSLIGYSKMDAVGIGTNVSIDALRCTALNDFVRVQVVGKMPDPTKARVTFTAGDGSSTFFPTVDPTGTYVYQYKKSGTYNIRIELYDSYTAQRATGTCNVTIVVPVDQVATCSLGADGEFDYVDSVKNHGWTAVNDVAPTGGSLQLSSGNMVTHGLTGCSFTTIDIDESVKPGVDSGFQMNDNSSSAFGVIFSANGVIENSKGQNIGNWTSDSLYHLVKLKVDYLAKEAYIYYDGVLLYSESLKMGTVSSVTAFGQGTIDYIRIGTSGYFAQGGTGFDIGLSGNPNLLDNCNATMYESDDMIYRRSHLNLDLYCASRDDGVCDYSVLRSVAVKYQSCVKEVFNYCVYVEYPRNEGIPASQSAAAGSLQGGTVCMAVLGTGEMYEGIAKPVVSTIWDMLIASPIMILLIVIVILAAVALTPKRRP